MLQYVMGGLAAAAAVGLYVTRDKDPAKEHPPTPPGAPPPGMPPAPPQFPSIPGLPSIPQTPGGLLNPSQLAAKPGDLVVLDTARLMQLRGLQNPPGGTLVPPGIPAHIVMRVESADATTLSGRTEDANMPLQIPMLNVPRLAVDGIVG